MKKAATLIVLAFGCFVIFCLWPVEYEKVNSPSGEFVAIASCHNYQHWLPSSPGQSGDKPGWITVRNKEGMKLGTERVEMLSFVRDIQWNDDLAEIRLVAEWNLKNK